jgi:putative nucleotidyltransferase with HDIG domain
LVESSKEETTPQERINAIAQFVKERFDEVAADNPALIAEVEYRWPHTLRVSSYAKAIAEREGANLELAIAAGLLHDVAHFEEGEYQDHGRDGAKIADPLLRELGYMDEEVECICYAVAVHVDGIADFTPAYSLEAEVLSDADNIDRFGPYRVVQACSGFLDDYPKLLEFVRERLMILERYQNKNPLDTEGGDVKSSTSSWIFKSASSRLSWINLYIAFYPRLYQGDG